MTSGTSYEDDGHVSPDFDLSQIFIGRDQQMDLFDLYLNRWKRLMVAAPARAGRVLETVAVSHRKRQYRRGYQIRPLKYFGCEL